MQLNPFMKVLNAQWFYENIDCPNIYYNINNVIIFFSCLFILFLCNFIIIE